jgi:hypothetical protein
VGTVDGVSKDGVVANGSEDAATEDREEAAAVDKKTDEKPAAEAKGGSGQGGKTQLALGRGLDIGTCNLVSAAEKSDGNLTYRSLRNAFIDVDINDFTKKMLTKLGVQYVMHNRRMYVLGSPAFELANIFNRETRRPMASGLISPHEADALPIIRLLISQVLGEPARDNEPCFYSVPGEPIDSQMNVVYHRDIFDGLLTKLGFKPQWMAEGHALVFAELAEDDFTGVAISCGAGMFNICVAYKTVPAVVFSTSRGGDWVDNNAAMVLGMKAPRVTAIKEKGIDLMHPKNREEEAVVIYYRNLINYTLINIKQRFESAEGIPTFPDAVDIVCSGGTSKPDGFVDLFSEEFKRIDFPLEVKNIRRATEPLNAVAQGCLLAAKSGME